MNDVKIDGFVLEDGVIQRWTGWYFDNIGSGHQACITIVHEGEFYPVLVNWEEFVPLPHHPKDFIEIHGQLKILTMGGFQRIVIVADSFKISAS